MKCQIILNYTLSQLQIAKAGPSSIFCMRHESGMHLKCEHANEPAQGITIKETISETEVKESSILIGSVSLKPPTSPEKDTAILLVPQGRALCLPVKDAYLPLSKGFWNNFIGQLYRCVICPGAST
jgi:hypothetical protein